MESTTIIAAALLMQRLFRTHAPYHTEATPQQVASDRARKLGQGPRPASPFASSYGNRWRASPWHSNDISAPEAGKIPLEAWEAHLRGDFALGLVPVDTGGGCYWGAIDIDLVTMTDDMQDDRWWVEHLRQEGGDFGLLPFRSTSGAVHLYLHSPTRVTTVKIVQILRDLRQMYEIDPTVELFPKQVRLSPDGRGSFINLPLYGAFSGSDAPWQTPGFRRPISADAFQPDQPADDGAREAFEQTIIDHLQRGCDIADAHGDRISRLESDRVSRTLTIGVGDLVSPAGDAGSSSPPSPSRTASTKPKPTPPPPGGEGPPSFSEAIFGRDDQSDGSPEQVAQLEELSRAATSDELAAIFMRSMKSALCADFFTLGIRRAGTRHDTLLRLSGYVAGAEPRVTGVVELLNSMLGDPMDDSDPTLRGLINSHDQYRRRAWIRRGDEILGSELKFGLRSGGVPPRANKAKPEKTDDAPPPAASDAPPDASIAMAADSGEESRPKTKSKSGDSPRHSLPRGPHGGVILDIFGDASVDSFDPPEVMGMEQVNQTGEFRLRVRWRPEPSSSLWRHEGADPEKRFVDGVIEFPDFSVFCSYASAKKTIERYFTCGILMARDAWPKYADVLRHTPGLFEYVDDEATISASLAAAAFMKIMRHMRFRAKNIPIIDKKSRFLTRKEIKSQKYIIFRSLRPDKRTGGGGALVELSSACMGTTAEGSAKLLQKFLREDYKNRIIRDSFIDLLKNEGFHQGPAQFDNGRSDGGEGLCRCWRILESLLNVHHEIRDSVCSTDAEGNETPPDRDTEPEKFQAYQDIIESPEPAADPDFSYDDPDRLGYIPEQKPGPGDELDIF